MVKEGRTVKQAMAAGTYYSISAPCWGEYAPPACETPAEVLECAKRTFPNITAGMAFRVTRIKGGTIGCRFVEDFGTITA